jgi:CDP-diacylglycerol--glycerol-3-phosphate 3-phosphatidyltransferase
MIARDVIVDASRMHASSKGIVVPANIYGKLKTISQMFAIIIIFFIFNSSIQNSQWWFSQNIMMWLALFFSVMSGVIYVFNIYKPVHQHE